MNFERGNGYTAREERDAVKKGALLLDKILPGWYRHIKLKRLKMENGAQCMMGQLFGLETEAKLAREMYPKEMEELPETSNGFYRAMIYLDSNWTGRNLIYRLMQKLGIANDPKIRKRYDALMHVCAGHDTKCLWAEEVASRKAKEQVAKDDSKKAS